MAAQSVLVVRILSVEEGSVQKRAVSLGGVLSSGYQGPKLGAALKVVGV